MSHNHDQHHDHDHEAKTGLNRRAFLQRGGLYGAGVLLSLIHI